MHPADFFRVAAVQLDDDTIGHAADCRQDTDTACRNDFAVFRHIGCFDDGYVDLA